MFRQDIPELNQGVLPFKSYGCKLCSYFFWLEQVEKTTLQIDDILSLTEQLIGDMKYLTKNLEIHKEYERLLPQYLGIDVKESKRTGPEYVCKRNELEILWLVKPGYNHFVPGDGKGNYVWDSLGRRDSQRYYTVAGKRIMVL